MRFLPSFFAVVALALPLSARAQNFPPPLPNGTLAPAFVTKTVAGKPLSLRSLRGKVVLLDYWATWCGPCRLAMPTLQQLHKDYSKRGLRVVGMSLDDAGSAAAVRPFLKTAGFTYTVTNSFAANARAAQQYRVVPIPTMYLIDKQGRIRWSEQGFDPDGTPSLRALIRKLLAEKT